MCMFKYIYIHTHTYIYIHTHIHTYIHTYIYIRHILDFNNSKISKIGQNVEQLKVGGFAQSASEFGELEKPNWEETHNSVRP